MVSSDMLFGIISTLLEPQKKNMFSLSQSTIIMEYRHPKVDVAGIILVFKI
jgi:hypothetical protein